MLTHRDLLNNGMAIGLALKATEEDRICAPVPLYHCFGSVIGSMVSVVNGATLILPSAQFDALATLRSGPARARHHALRRADHVRRGAGASRSSTASISRSLRKGVMSGAPCPIELMKRVGRAHAHASG